MIYNRNGSTIIFNTLSSAILRLNKEYSNYLLKSIADENTDGIPNDLFENLKMGKMVHEPNNNELEQLEVINKITRFQDSNLALTIAPTLDCNFACPYCYENGRRYNTMNQEVVNKTLEFIKGSMETRKNLSITWYGGEPLLGIDIIEQITEAIKKESFNYSSTMVTNGYLLDLEMAKKLRNLKVDIVQITVDGPPKIHDKRRYLRNREGTFDILLKNISEICDLIPVKIRVNVDNNTIDYIDELFDYFDCYDLKGKVTVILAPIQNINGNCKTPGCMTDSEFSKSQIQYYTRNYHRGYFDIQVPSLSTACCAISSSSMIIDPNGNLYKCWDDIGNSKEIVGTIYEGIRLNNNLTQWLNYNPLSNDECKECKIYPICQGGCANYVIKKNCHNCHPLKYSDNEFIDLLKDIRL